MSLINIQVTVILILTLKIPLILTLPFTQQMKKVPQNMSLNLEDLKELIRIQLTLMIIIVKTTQITTGVA